MARIEGKDLVLWFGGIEVPVESVTLGTAFDTVENTDSATETTGKDHDVIRAARSFTAEAFLYEALGTEIVTGTLVLGTRYQVTGGTLGTGIGDHTIGAVGSIFTSLGNETATSTNKVKPLGAKINGLDMAVTIGSEIPVVDAEYSVKFDELDVTDSASAGDSKEMTTSRGDRELKFSGFVYDTVADALTTSPASTATTLQFKTGQTVVGNTILTSKNITDSVSDVAKIDYTAKWIGAPTETLMGLTGGTSAAFVMILKGGGQSTDKLYKGTAVLTSKTVKGSVTSSVKVSYGFSVTGVQTETEYS